MHNLYENGVNVLYLKRPKQTNTAFEQEDYIRQQRRLRFPGSSALPDHELMDKFSLVCCPWEMLFHSSDDKISVKCRFSLFLCFSLL